MVQPATTTDDFILHHRDVCHGPAECGGAEFQEQAREFAEHCLASFRMGRVHRARYSLVGQDEPLIRYRRRRSA